MTLHRLPGIVPAPHVLGPATVLRRLRHLARVAATQTMLSVTRPAGSGCRRWTLQSKTCFNQRTVWHFSCGQAIEKVVLPTGPERLVDEVVDEAVRVLALVMERSPEALRSEVLAPEGS